MIKNDQQYEITKSQIVIFESALNDLACKPALDPLLKKLEGDALRSQLDELRESAEQYEVGSQSGDWEPER